LVADEGGHGVLESVLKLNWLNPVTVVVDVLEAPFNGADDDGHGVTLAEFELPLLFPLFPLT
jgi:hypothetical protein